MAKSPAEAREELEKEFRQFREGLGSIHVALGDLDQAEATDDVYGLLDKLENIVRDVRTGGVVGSGAKGHREARQEWLQVGSS